MRIAIGLGVLLAASIPTAALAQGLGMDLSGEEEPKKEETPKKDDLLAPSDADTAKPAAESKLSEVDIAIEDRVKAVQRKAFIKRGRFELTPMGFLTVNDAFFPKFGPGARGSFFFQDSLGLGLRAQQYNLIPNDNVRLAKRQLQSRLPSVLPKFSVSADLMWSPIYGKVSLFNAIQTFDLYVLGGAGVMFSQTSEEDGAHVETHIGIGQRFSVSSFMAVDVSLIETLYPDRPGGLARSVLQHVLSVNGGVSFFLPTSFEYKLP